MACDPLTYVGVDASKWMCARDIASRESGIPIDADRGEASKWGVKLKWRYEVSEQTLHIQASKKLWAPVSCDKINDRIRGAAEKCGLTAGRETSN